MNEKMTKGTGNEKDEKVQKELRMKWRSTKGCENEREKKQKIENEREKTKRNCEGDRKEQLVLGMKAKRKNNRE